MGRARMMVGGTLIALMAAFAGCADSGEQGFADELDIDLERMEQRPGGLYIEDVEVGSGAEAVDGQLVSVHYTGWLADGREFDSSRDGGVPLEVVIGRGNVIAGWDQGIPGMREGGRRRLVIPPAMAYGSAGAGGVIPPDATLVFDVELIEVRSPDAPAADAAMPGDSAVTDAVGSRDTAR